MTPRLRVELGSDSPVSETLPIAGVEIPGVGIANVGIAGVGIPG